MRWHKRQLGKLPNPKQQAPGRTQGCGRARITTIIPNDKSPGDSQQLRVRDGGDAQVVGH